MDYHFKKKTDIIVIEQTLLRCIYIYIYIYLTLYSVQQK